MNRTCRECGAHATHMATCQIPRLIITAGDREWPMLEEVHRWFCDNCIPEHGSTCADIGCVAHPSDKMNGPGTAQTAPAPSGPQEAQL